VRKLVLDDILEDINYALIGIHCSIEDYRLAYLLNQFLGLNLKRKVFDIDYNNTSSYSIFEWEDTKQLVVWNLVSNISKVEIDKASDANSLFNDEERFTKTHHLIPEFKKVNFILKINDNPSPSIEKHVLNKILSIPQIVTAYSIDANQLKSKDHLIFN